MNGSLTISSILKKPTSLCQFISPLKVLWKNARARSLQLVRHKHKSKSHADDLELFLCGVVNFCRCLLSSIASLVGFFYDRTRQVYSH